MLNRQTLQRWTIGIFLLSMAVSTAARGQDQPNVSPEQQQLMDQMRQNFDTIRQNMQAKGIDPGQFFQQMRQGADPADIQKQLIDQGIIDPQLAAQMQTTMQKLTTSRLRDQLQCSDAEYAVMDPMIQKVIATSNAVGTGGGMRMGGFSTAAASPASAELYKAKRALHMAIADPNTTPDQFAAILKDLRDARVKVKEELDAARRDLVGVLNVRQEAALTSIGLLE